MSELWIGRRGSPGAGAPQDHVVPGAVLINIFRIFIIGIIYVLIT